MGPYGCILADPPWRYGGTAQFQGKGRRREVQGRFRGPQRLQYPAMHTDDIAALPVASLAADPSVLLLWATWPMLPDALYVIRSWGFEYVSGLPWIKVLGPPKRRLFKHWHWTPQFGIGFWVRSCSELILIARRGAIAPRTSQIGLISENFGHSRKPDNLYEYAAQFPGPHLELFGRRPFPGWTVAGNGVSGLDIRDELADLARQQMPRWLEAAD